MRFTLRTDVKGLYFAISIIADEIPEPIRSSYYSMKTFDDPDLCSSVWDIPADSLEVEIIRKNREITAEHIAKDLAKLIVKEMKRYDEHNGHRVND